MKRLLITIVCCMAALLLCILFINRVQSGADATVKLRNFRHWTVQAHWTNPATRIVKVLLDEEAVTGTDSKCESVLEMLDRLTSIVPSWSVELVSPTGWVPVRWNPIDREGVEWMLKDVPDPDDERAFERTPPPAYRHVMRTESSH